MFSKTKRLKPVAITPPKSNRNTGSMITLYPSELQVTTSNDMSHLLLYEKYRRDRFPGAFVYISSPLIHGESHLSNFHFYPLDNNTISSLRVTL